MILPRSTHCVIFILFCFLLGAASAASAQDVDLAGCKNPVIENLSGIRFPVKNEQGVEEMRMILTGSAERPVRIDCDEIGRAHV